MKQSVPRNIFIGKYIWRQSFVIAADFIHMHGTVRGFFLKLNGVIYVDEENRKDRTNTKILMISAL